MKVLVAYATRYGSTGEVAEKIGEVMRAKGAEVDVANIKDKPDPRGYDAAVVGGAIYIMMFNGKTKGFVARHRKTLKDMPVAYFCLSGTMKDDTPENREKIGSKLNPMKKKVAPVDVGLFGGAFDPSKGPKMMASESASDDRDWDAISAWAEELISKFKVK
ncbi:flavodoxin domain-containing protein [candidate division WOR-3 bacterium]|nr:flavodoxin domain-containing protein [candidate division WOR-3 bacterium]